MLYHSIKLGSLTLSGNLFLAPVAGYSDRSFRSICIENGADFTYTEMVSSEALVRGSGKTEQILSRARNEYNYGIQIFGSTPEITAQSARIILEKESPSLIDINAGCPVPKIVKTGAGSALTRDPERLYLIVKSVVNAVNPLPVTVKIRSGWDNNSLTWKEAALAVVEGGACAITLHPSTRAQGYEGYADWDILKELKLLLNKRIPVFGSGDLFSPEDALDMFTKTGCDGVMFARGAINNPFIFMQTKMLLTHGKYEQVTVSDRINAGIKELNLLAEDKGELIACREMRKKFCAYSKGLSGGAELRASIVNISTINEYYALFSDIINNNDCQKS